MKRLRCNLSSDILIAQKIYSVLMAIQEVKRLYFNIIFLSIILLKKKQKTSSVDCLQFQQQHQFHYATHFSAAPGFMHTILNTAPIIALKVLRFLLPAHWFCLRRNNTLTLDCHHPETILTMCCELVGTLLLFKHFYSLIIRRNHYNWCQQSHICEVIQVIQVFLLRIVSWLTFVTITLTKTNNFALRKMLLHLLIFFKRKHLVAFVVENVKVRLINERVCLNYMTNGLGIPSLIYN